MAYEPAVLLMLCCGEWRPDWSITVLAVCVDLCIPLTIVRFVPSLREEARRRFHM